MVKTPYRSGLSYTINVSLLKGLRSALVGIRFLLKGSWGVLDTGVVEGPYQTATGSCAIIFAMAQLSAEA